MSEYSQKCKGHRFELPLPNSHSNRLSKVEQKPPTIVGGAREIGAELGTKRPTAKQREFHSLPRFSVQETGEGSGERGRGPGWRCLAQNNGKGVLAKYIRAVERWTCSSVATIT
jgi:hypothetical protein